MSTTDGAVPAKPDRDAVVTETVLDAEPAKVWRALTEPEIVADWLGAKTIELGPRPRFGIAREKDRPAIACEIVAAEPPDRLSYAWREENGGRQRGGDSIVTFELSPVGQDRTHLRIVHRRVDTMLLSGPATRRSRLTRSATTRARATALRLAA